MAFQTLENDKNNRGQIKRKNLKNEIRSAWLGLMDVFQEDFVSIPFEKQYSMAIS